MEEEPDWRKELLGLEDEETPEKEKQPQQPPQKPRETEKTPEEEPGEKQPEEKKEETGEEKAGEEEKTEKEKEEGEKQEKEQQAEKKQEEKQGGEEKKEKPVQKPLKKTAEETGRELLMELEATERAAKQKLLKEIKKYGTTIIAIILLLVAYGFYSSQQASSSYESTECGNLVCEPGEETTCSLDCGENLCGNAECGENENCANCPADCTCPQGQTCSPGATGADTKGCVTPVEQVEKTQCGEDKECLDEALLNCEPASYANHIISVEISGQADSGCEFSVQTASEKLDCLVPTQHLALGLNILMNSEYCGRETAESPTGNQTLENQTENQTIVQNETLNQTTNQSSGEQEPEETLEWEKTLLGETTSLSLATADLDSDEKTEAYEVSASFALFRIDPAVPLLQEEFLAQLSEKSALAAGKFGNTGQKLWFSNLSQVYSAQYAGQNFTYSLFVELPGVVESLCLADLTTEEGNELYAVVEDCGETQPCIMQIKQNATNASFSKILDINPGYSGFSAGDADRDGANELYWTQNGVINRLKKQQNWARETLGALGNTWTNIAIGDADNDRKDDIVVSDGTRIIFFQQQVSPILVGTLEAPLSDLKLADLDNDGNTEIISAGLNNRLNSFQHKSGKCMLEGCACPTPWVTAGCELVECATGQAVCTPTPQGTVCKCPA